MRYLLWQFRHLHSFYFTTTGNETSCPECGAVYKQRKPMSTNKETAPAPNPERSPLVVLTFVFLLLGAVSIIVAAAFSFPYVAIAGLLNGLTAIALAVLSLREKN